MIDRGCRCLDEFHPGLTHEEYTDILDEVANETLKRQAVASATWAMSAMEHVAQSEIARLKTAVRLMEQGRIRDASKLPERECRAYRAARSAAREGALKRALARDAPRQSERL